MNKYAPWLSDEGFHALPVSERALLIAAYFCDRLRVKEAGRNRGRWVEEFQKSAGVEPGAAWCACFVTYCLKAAGYAGKIPGGPAAVRNWFHFAQAADQPRRGDLFCWLNPDRTGHIGFVTRVVGPLIHTIEGNTDTDGTREGDGVYRKIRTRAGKRFLRP
jgi:hypothetical protein